MTHDVRGGLPAERHDVGRRASAAVAMLLGLSSLTVSSPLRAAAPSAEECAKASEDAQLARIHERLREAHARFATCTHDACPAVIRRDCAKQLEAVDTSMPTIVLGVSDDAGEIMVVRITVDGAPLVERLDGRALPIDPGVHTFRFEASGHTAIEQRVTVREGEKNRAVLIRMTVEHDGPAVRPPPVASAPAPAVEPPAPRDSQPRGSLLLPAAATGVALALAGVGIYLGVTTKSRYDDLHTRCAPFCPQSDIDAVHGRAVAADVVIGSALVATAIAAVLWFTTVGSHPSALRAAPGSQRASLLRRIWK